MNLRNDGIEKSHELTRGVGNLCLAQKRKVEEKAFSFVVHKYKCKRKIFSSVSNVRNSIK